MNAPRWTPELRAVLADLLTEQAELRLEQGASEEQAQHHVDTLRAHLLARFAHTLPTPEELLAAAAHGVPTPLASTPPEEIGPPQHVSVVLALAGLALVGGVLSVVLSTYFNHHGETPVGNGFGVAFLMLMVTSLACGMVSWRTVLGRGVALSAGLTLFMVLTLLVVLNSGP
ncbi:MAG: hypothetical protein AAFX99_05070 [Myxococcota bacterium]